MPPARRARQALHHPARRLVPHPAPTGAARATHRPPLPRLARRASGGAVARHGTAARAAGRRRRASRTGSRSRSPRAARASACARPLGQPAAARGWGAGGGGASSASVYAQCTAAAQCRGHVFISNFFHKTVIRNPSRAARPGPNALRPSPPSRPSAPQQRIHTAPQQRHSRREPAQQRPRPPHVQPRPGSSSAPTPRARRRSRPGL